MITLPHNSDCLIYNDYGAGENRHVIRHALPSLWWEEKKGVSVIKSGFTSENSIEVIVSERKGYLEPHEWQQLTLDEALSGNYYTIQENDRMIQENPPDAPETFTSTMEVDQHFTTDLARTIMSVGTMRLPGGTIHHHEIRCR